VPAFYFALAQEKEAWLAFSLLFGFGCMLLYTYYATVYSSIQDVIEPSLRATAMALYFCAMYALGGALGPIGIGYISEYVVHQKAAADGVELAGLDKPAQQKLLEPYRAAGISTAMYALPIVSFLLAGSLFAGARTVGRDVENLQRWMRESTSGEPPKPKLEKVAT
jgi:MFS family permease